MATMYPENWPLSDDLQQEEWPTPIAVRPLSHQPRQFSDAVVFEGNNDLQPQRNNIFSYGTDHLRSTRLSHAGLDSPYPARTTQQHPGDIDSVRLGGNSMYSEDSWYVGQPGSDRSSMQNQNMDVGNRNSYATSKLSNTQTMDTTYSDSLYSTSSAPKDSYLDFLNYYTSSNRSNGETERQHEIESDNRLIDSPSWGGFDDSNKVNVDAFCDKLMDSYKKLGPSPCSKSNTDSMRRMGAKVNTNKPLPPLPAHLQQTMSTSTLSPSDFAPRDDDKENASTPASIITHPGTGPSTQDSVLNSKTALGCLNNGGPELPLPIPWDVGFDEAGRLLMEHMQSRKPYVNYINEIIQRNLGVLGEEFTFEGVEDFGPALDLQSVSGDFIDVTGKRERKWGQRTRLREALLAHGNERYGKQTKIELASITFHDLTTGEGGGFQNELLAHYDSNERPASKIMLYEVEVPLPLTALHQVPRTERWLHILISVPFVAHVPSKTLDAYRVCSPPSSWVTIAAPLHCITVHEQTKENYAAKNLCSISKTHHRFDFDFGPAEGMGGRHGVRKEVQFEFMDKVGKSDLFVNGCGDSENDEEHQRKIINMEWPCMIQKLQSDVGQNINFVCPQISTDIPAPGSSGGHGIGSRPFHTHSRSRSQASIGKFRTRSQQQLMQEWYKELEEKVHEDAARWTRIHDAMMKGKCRVICRAEESSFKMVLRSASKRLGRTGLSRELSR